MFSVKVTIFLLLTSAVEATWNIINDVRVRNKDVTPVLGRGYSMATGEYLSICMVVSDITDPTSDYDFFFESAEKTVGGSVSYSKKVFSSASGSTVNSKTNSEGSNEFNYQHLVAIMKSDRYYKSIDETTAPLISLASQILSRGDVMQFFQSCGPSYIRSMRRTMELTAKFKYISNSLQVDRSTSEDTEGVASTFGENKSFKFNKSVSRLYIDIFAFGMGLIARDDPDASLLAKDVDDFKRVMDTAFKSMQDPFSGMVASVELVPWTSNAAFQNALNLDTPMSRNFYRCYRDENGNTENRDGVTTTCDDESDCGYAANGTAPSDLNLCRVAGTEDALHKDLRKFNLIANAEFVARIDALIRRDATAIQVHISCISDLLMIPREYYDEELTNRRSGYYDSSSVTTISVNTLTYRLLNGDSIDVVPTPDSYLETPLPNDDLLFYKRMKLFTDYIEGFFQLCMLEMGETKYDVENGNMQLKHWTAIPKCNKIMCTLPNMEYDGSTCVPVEEDFFYLNNRLDEYCPPELIKVRTGEILEFLGGIINNF